MFYGPKTPDDLGTFVFESVLFGLMRHWASLIGMNGTRPDALSSSLYTSMGKANIVIIKVCTIFSEYCMCVHIFSFYFVRYNQLLIILYLRSI